MTMRRLDHAVVAGGGIAGLLAARVLSGCFERVTLIERDTLTTSADPRKGVPQGRHVHVLLIRGRSILERYFPRLGDELRSQGAVLVNSGRELGWQHRGAWRVAYDSDLSLLCMSRPLVECRVAERVRSLPNVTVVDGARILGLRMESDGGVSAVRVSGAAGDSGKAEIEADLVVDAMGRGSAMPRWIAESGFPAPETELIPARVTYASCTLRRATDWPRRRALLITGAPARRGGSLVPIEGNRWLLTLISYFDEPPPQDHESALAFAQSLNVPAFHDTISNSEPLSDIVYHRFPGSQRRRYDALTRFPNGLIVLGDGVCSFNPVYGQGMTVSAIEAECLERELTRARGEGGIGPDFSHRWFGSIRPTIDAAWDGVLLEDLRFPELAARRSARLKLLLWYMDRIHQATYRSPLVADQFYRVANFLDAPTSLFRPRVLAEALPGGWKQPAAMDFR